MSDKMEASTENEISSDGDIERFVCDNCKCDIIDGERWRCTNCNRSELHGFDLCNLCYYGWTKSSVMRQKAKIHTTTHTFEKVTIPCVDVAVAAVPTATANTEEVTKKRRTTKKMTKISKKHDEINALADKVKTLEEEVKSLKKVITGRGDFHMADDFVKSSDIEAVVNDVMRNMLGELKHPPYSVNHEENTGGNKVATPKSGPVSKHVENTTQEEKMDTRKTTPVKTTTNTVGDNTAVDKVVASQVEKAAVDKVVEPHVHNAVKPTNLGNISTPILRLRDLAGGVPIEPPILRLRDIDGGVPVETPKSSPGNNETDEDKPVENDKVETQPTTKKSKTKFIPQNAIRGKSSNSKVIAKEPSRKSARVSASKSQKN